MNETIFALARSLAALLAGALFALNPRGPFIAAIVLIPIGMVLIARLRPIPAREEFVAMASTSNVILETVEMIEACYNFGGWKLEVRGWRLEVGG